MTIAIQEKQFSDAITKEYYKRKTTDSKTQFLTQRQFPTLAVGISRLKGAFVSDAICWEQREKRDGNGLSSHIWMFTLGNNIFEATWPRTREGNFISHYKNHEVLIAYYVPLNCYPIWELYRLERDMLSRAKDFLGNWYPWWNLGFHLTDYTISRILWRAKMLSEKERITLFSRYVATTHWMECSKIIARLFAEFELLQRWGEFGKIPWQACTPDDWMETVIFNPECWKIVFNSYKFDEADAKVIYERKKTLESRFGFIKGVQNLQKQVADNILPLRLRRTDLLT